MAMHISVNIFDNKNIMSYKTCSLRQLPSHRIASGTNQSDGNSDNIA